MQTDKPLQTALRKFMLQMDSKLEEKGKKKKNRKGILGLYGDSDDDAEEEDEEEETGESRSLAKKDARAFVYKMEQLVFQAVDEECLTEEGIRGLERSMPRGQSS